MRIFAFIFTEYISSSHGCREKLGNVNPETMENSGRQIRPKKVFFKNTLFFSPILMILEVRFIIFCIFGVGNATNTHLETVLAQNS